MSFDSKFKLRSVRWTWVVLFALSNFKSVRSVIFHYVDNFNATCEPVTYLKDEMYQCYITLNVNQPSERLLLNFNKLELNCTDSIYIYDGPEVTGDPTFKLTCENETGTVIYSTNDSISLELVTADDRGFNSTDFLLVYTPFTDSENGCENGFVCKDANKYCIPKRLECDSYYHCADGSDEDDNCVMVEDTDDRIKLIALVSFASFVLLLGIIWLCAHTRKVMRNREVIQRNGVTVTAVTNNN